MASNPPSPASPIPGVSALVIHDGRVLLVKRGRGSNRGLWALPGGRIEPGEGAAEAAVREVAEETAIAVGDLRQIDSVHVSADGLRYAITVFSAAYRSGRLRAGDDAAEARWVALADVQSLRIAESALGIIEKHGRAAHAA